MAKNSVCSVCGMTMEGEKKFCSACGSPATVQEIPDAVPEMNAGSENGMPETPVSPMENGAAASAPYPEMNQDMGMGAVPPVPPMDNNMGGVPPYAGPMMDNGMGGMPNYGGMNMNMNMGMQQEQPKSAKDGLAIAGMIVGIISIVLMCMNWIGILIAAVGLILSIMGIKSLRRKGMAVAGVICSVVGLLGSIIFLVMSLFIVNEAFEMTENIIGNEGDLEAFMEEYEDLYDDYEYEYYYEWE